jgi:murein L,D-transpeptidase YcbB/YkuD
MGSLKKGAGFLAVGHLLLTTVILSRAAATDWGIEAAGRMQQWLTPHSMTVAQGCSGQNPDSCADLIRFYQHRRFQLAWVGPNGLSPEGVLAMGAIRQAGSHGLLPSDYGQSWLDLLLDDLKAMPPNGGTTKSETYIQLDLAMTDMILRYAYHRTMGRTSPDLRVYGKQANVGQCRDLAGDLADMLTRGRLGDFLEALGPRSAGYQALQKSLARYKKNQSEGGWSVIDDGPDLRSGDCGPRVAQLKNRLAPLRTAPFASEWIHACFDDRLATEVKQFQRRHGLKEDGVAGANTLRAMNIPIGHRIRQIRLNLERWRWLPENPGSSYIRVNIPASHVHIVEAGKVVKTMRAVVGRKRRPTPALSSTLTHLEINPYWNVPSRIARLDLLPKIQENPGYLVRQNFRVFDSWDEDAQEIDPYTIDWSSYSKAHLPFRLRQEPDPRNALGRVKFMFPNEFSVYIHDTPSKSLFNRSSRHLSSGCVRLEKPLELLTYLLKRQDWNDARLSKLVASKRRQVVVLKRPVPVYLVYLTAWVEENGEIHFRDDIYGHDQQLLAAMDEAAGAGPTCNTIVVQPTNWVQTQQKKHSTL